MFDEIEENFGSIVGRFVFRFARLDLQTCWFIVGISKSDPETVSQLRRTKMYGNRVVLYREVTTKFVEQERLRAMLLQLADRMDVLSQSRNRLLHDGALVSSGDRQSFTSFRIESYATMHFPDMPVHLPEHFDKERLSKMVEECWILVSRISSTR